MYVCVCVCARARVYVCVRVRARVCVIVCAREQPKTAGERSRGRKTETNIREIEREEFENIEDRVGTPTVERRRKPKTTKKR